ncbi:hypothetical protein Z043_109159 [Scleropages formosus]|uniref:Protein Wnt n=1 Tax=Scleropages formosus TaxID=113540 RepID=A0A0N8K0E2_SCLFO|nr:hypothetical protein Z043_109159 [Scleropages formosus]
MASTAHLGVTCQVKENPGVSARPRMDAKQNRSLAVGHQYSSLGTQPILCGSIPGLVPKQLRFCRNYVEIMPSVAEGVKLGIQECQHQFRGRRWNCTTVNDNLAIFGPVLDKAAPRFTSLKDTDLRFGKQAKVVNVGNGCQSKFVAVTVLITFHRGNPQLL